MHQRTNDLKSDKEVPTDNQAMKDTCPEDAARAIRRQDWR